MAALVRTRVDDQGAVVIVSLPAGGCRFVARRPRVREALSVAASACGATDVSTHELPIRRTRAIGRGKIAVSLLAHLLRCRSITLVGHAKPTFALAPVDALHASGWRCREESHQCRT
jgi:hypothetical protein